MGSNCGRLTLSGSRMPGCKTHPYVLNNPAARKLNPLGQACAAGAPSICRQSLPRCPFLFECRSNAGGFRSLTVHWTMAGTGPEQRPQSANTYTAPCRGTRPRSALPAVPPDPAPAGALHQPRETAHFPRRTYFLSLSRLSRLSRLSLSLSLLSLLLVLDHRVVPRNLPRAPAAVVSRPAASRTVRQCSPAPAAAP